MSIASMPTPCRGTRGGSHRPAQRMPRIARFHRQSILAAAGLVLSEASAWAQCAMCRTVSAERSLERGRQHRDAVLAAFAVPENDVVQPPQPLTEHPVREEKDGTERLVLRGRAHAALGQMRDECRHLPLPELPRVALAMKDDEQSDPLE